DKSDVDRARARTVAAVRLVLEAGTEAVDEGLVILAVPLPEDRRQIARIAEGLGLRRKIPQRILRIAEVKAGEPGLALAEAAADIEEAILERKLEARGVPAART